MSYNQRIQLLLMEINIYRRLWKAWNENCPEKRPSREDHHSITHMFLSDHVKASLFFRFVVRFYALLEEDGKKFTFGYWLDSLKPSLAVRRVQKKYKALISSEDFKKLLKNRHTTFAHNALKIIKIPHTYNAVFQMSTDLEKFYDEIVADRQAQAIPWTGELDPRMTHITNCRGGIEQNILEFFQKLED